jgi:hypothetical protein
MHLNNRTNVKTKLQPLPKADKGKGAANQEPKALNTQFLLDSILFNA